MGGSDSPPPTIIIEDDVEQDEIISNIDGQNENQAIADSKTSLQRWSQAFLCCMLVGIITFGMVSVYANFQGSDRYESIEYHFTIENDGYYIASGISKPPSGLSWCNFQIGATQGGSYTLFGGERGIRLAAGDCDNVEIEEIHRVENFSFNHKTGEWEIVLSEDPGRVWISTQGEYSWKLSDDGLIGLCIVLNLVGLILIGKQFGVMPPIVFSIPVIVIFSPPMMILFFC